MQFFQELWQVLLNIPQHPKKKKKKRINMCTMEAIIKIVNLSHKISKETVLQLNKLIPYKALK